MSEVMPMFLPTPADPSVDCIHMQDIWLGDGKLWRVSTFEDRDDVVTITLETQPPAGSASGEFRRVSPAILFAGYERIQEGELCVWRDDLGVDRV